MKIAIDTSVIKDSRKLAHRVRGTGFYISNLKEALLKYFPYNKYVFFSNLSELPADIDVIHYPYFEPFFLTLPIFSKNKRVVTVHDLTPLVFPKHFKTGLKGMLKWQIQKIALRNIDIIITDSESSKRDIIKFTGISKDKISVVYLAASEKFKKLKKSSILRTSIREKYNLPDKFVLYVGDVTWNKNLPRLIEAVKKINVPLVMVGNALVKSNVDLSNSWNSDFAKVLKSVDGDKRIIRLGFVSNEELVLLYNSATVFAMPSLYEGFGLPILEAMSCGCPVVTSKEGSIPEITGEASMGVNAYDTDSIANGISKVFSNQDLQLGLSERGLKQSSKFNWKKVADETMRAYREIV